MKKLAYEKKMMGTIDEGNFDEIEKIITPRNFQRCMSSSLCVAMEVWIEVKDQAPN